LSRLPSSDAANRRILPAISGGADVGNATATAAAARAPNETGFDAANIGFSNGPKKITTKNKTVEWNRVSMG
jgi:hypothetical protein